MDDAATRTRVFVWLFRPFTPWATAEMLGEVIGDVDFRTRSKHQMAEDDAHGRYGLDQQGLQDLGESGCGGCDSAHTYGRKRKCPRKAA